MSAVTLVYAYYENPGMLEKHIAEWTGYNELMKRHVRVIIVDDGSQRGPAEAVLRHLKPIGVHTRLFRIIEDKPWNQDGARNLGMHKAETEWCMLMDMDLVLERNEVGKMIHFADHEAKIGEYYMPSRVDAYGLPLHPHPNAYLFRKLDFWRMGGYDEDFSGCYGSDGNFRKCMRAGLREVHTMAWKLKMYGRSQIPDASTVDYGRKESKFWRPNFPHLEVKRRSPPYKAVNPLRFEWMEVAL